MKNDSIDASWEKLNFQILENNGLLLYRIFRMNFSRKYDFLRSCKTYRLSLDFLKSITSYLEVTNLVVQGFWAKYLWMRPWFIYQIQGWFYFHTVIRVNNYCTIYFTPSICNTFSRPLIDCQVRFDFLLALKFWKLNKAYFLCWKRV